MNDQIQELAEQAGFYLHNDVIDGNDFKYEIEKFAELILFECIKLAVFRGDAATGKVIKEHFGLDK